MSMPQYIEIAVVSSSINGFEPIQGVRALATAGIAPRYRLVTIHPPERHGVTHLDLLETAQIGLWVALDDESMHRCQELYTALSSRPGYSRGFYDDLLPVAVIRIKDLGEFLALTDKVMEAFCASS